MPVIFDTMTYENFMRGVANDLTNEFVKVAPVDTGFLKNSIRCEVVGDKIEVYMPEYAIFLEYGTGIYVEAGYGSGNRIYPKTKKCLHWVDKNGEHFAKSIAGMHPQPFIRNVFYHRLQQIINVNAAMHLGTEIEVSFE
jgi:hypothetical protein